MFLLVIIVTCLINICFYKKIWLSKELTKTYQKQHYLKDVHFGLCIFPVIIQLRKASFVCVQENRVTTIYVRLYLVIRIDKINSVSGDLYS